MPDSTPPDGVSMWSQNFFADRSPLVSKVARNYFVRGAVSGVGLADILLAEKSIGYRPSVSFAEGLRRVFADYRSA